MARCEPAAGGVGRAGAQRGEVIVTPGPLPLALVALHHCPAQRHPAVQLPRPQPAQQDEAAQQSFLYDFFHRLIYSLHSAPTTEQQPHGDDCCARLVFWSVYWMDD